MALNSFYCVFVKWITCGYYLIQHSNNRAIISDSINAQCINVDSTVQWTNIELVIMYCLFWIQSNIESSWDKKKI